MQILCSDSLKIKCLNTCCVSHADPRKQELEDQLHQHPKIFTIQKHFFHCPQTILYLDFQCRDGVSELQ